MKKVKISTLGRLLQQNEVAQEQIWFTANAEKWYRVASTYDYVMSSVGLISFVSRYNYTAPFSASLLLSTKYRSAGFIKVIEKTAGLYVTKARIVYPINNNGVAYIEFYYANPQINELLFVLSGQRNIKLLQTATEGEIPSGYSSYEITL